MTVENITELLKEIIENKEYGIGEKKEKILEVFENNHNADIAEALENLNEKERYTIYEMVESEDIASILPDLSTELQSEIITVIENDKLKKIFEEMSDDDIADIFGELSEDEVKHLLKLLDREEREDLENLIKHESDTAGGLMTTDYLAVFSGEKIRDVMEIIRRDGEAAEMLYYIYVIEKESGKLQGIVSLRDLLINRQEIVVDRIMETNIISVTTDTDQEIVAEYFSKYDLIAIPVVDENGKMTGMITVDDIIDVIKEEAIEDIYTMAGLSEEEDEKKDHGIVSAVKIRLPWLMVSFFGELFSAVVMKKFDGVLSQLVTLAFFVPLIMAMGGNSGSQSSAVMVRKIALGEATRERLKKAVIKESAAGLFLGVISGVMVGIIVYFWQNGTEESLKLGIIIGTALFIAVAWAAIFGTFIPIFFNKFKIDPAVASGPFITTLNDIGGILIYFSLASIMLKAS